MPARLIINADDFGLTAGINRSIEELHRAGVLSSATLMANGPAFDDAVAIAKRNPHLGIGCHIVLTDGVPVAPFPSISSLLHADRRGFRPSLPAFAAAALLGRISKEEIKTEALAQIRKLQASQIFVTHLDTHKHTHLFPVVSRALLEAARITSVPAIRNPFEPRWSTSLGFGSKLRRLQISMLRRLQHRFFANVKLVEGSITTTDGTIGISATGHLDARTLRLMLDALPHGTWELVCHPGYNDADLSRVTTRLRDHRAVERNALLDVVSEVLARPGAPTLINYASVSTQSSPCRPSHRTSS